MRNLEPPSEAPKGARQALAGQASRLAQARGTAPRPASVDRPLFKSQADLDRFMKDFTGPSLKAAAPVQTEESGWQNYLSRGELRELGEANRGRISAGLLGLAGLAGQGLGGYLFLTASVAAPFVFLAGSAVALGAGLYSLKSGRHESAIEREGKRREADAEVAARHANKPQGPFA